MSYRFGLSPADVVTDKRGNLLNTTLFLYVAEADAEARTNELTSVPVTNGDWSYSSDTYKFLWARTSTSDTFFVVSAEGLEASLDVDTALTVTDNGDGGFTVGGAKVGGWQWVKDTFVTIANAVGLATTNPLPPGTAFAGTAETAARGDHVHPTQATQPTLIRTSSGQTVTMHTNGNPMSTSTLDRVFFAPVFIRSYSGGALSVTQLGANVTTAASAGGTIRVGLWPSLSNGDIDIANKLFDSGELSSTTTGLKMASSVQTLQPGVYWVGVVMHTATCQLTQGNHNMTFQDNFNAGQMWGFAIMNGITGALPTTGGLATGGDGAPQLFLTLA